MPEDKNKWAQLSPLCTDDKLWPEADKNELLLALRLPVHRSQHRGAQHTASAPCTPATHFLWKEATTTEVRKQVPYLSLRHDVQILLIDGEGHVSKDWAPVLENCHHFILNSTMGRTICSDLEEAQTDYR